MAQDDFNNPYGEAEGNDAKEGGKKKKGRGEFFAIGREEWEKACEHGLNIATTFLVMARGTGGDQRTSTWSTKAVAAHTGIAKPRAKRFIGEVCEAGLAEKTRGGNFPIYKVARPESLEDMIWLPNSIVDGVGNATPPIRRLRQGQEIETLRLFVNLYGEQDLAADGGLPRKMIRQVYKRAEILEQGQYVVYGFNDPGTSSCWPVGPLARFWDKSKGGDDPWEPLNTLQRLGLIERVLYLAESEDPDAELIHALSGDEYASMVQVAVYELRDSLPEGFCYEAEKYDLVLPVMQHMKKAAVVGVYRMTYRAKTSLTSAWYGQHVESCRRFAELYEQLSRGEFRQTA